MISMNDVQSNSVRPYLESVFSGLNETGAQYAVLRNFETLPDEVRHDVDMLVAPEAVRLAVDAIRQGAPAADWVVRDVRDGACLTVFVEHPSTGRRMHFDLSSGPRWYVFEFVDWRMILTNRVLFNNIYVANAPSEAVVCLMLRLLYGGYVKEEYKSKIQRSASGAASGDAMRAVLSPWLGSRMAGHIVEWAGKGEWAEIEKRVGGIRFRVVLGNLCRPLSALKHFSHDAICCAMRLFRSSRRES